MLKKKCVKNNKDELYIVVYNEKGQLLSVINRFGNVYNYTYRDGLLYNVGIRPSTDSMGYEYSHYEYDDDNNLIYYQIANKYKGMIYNKSQCVVMLGDRLYYKNF